MKVVLLEKNVSLGKKWDIVNVKDGYALNFLFPKKLAQKLTPQLEKEILEKQKKTVFQAEEIKAMEKEVSKKIKELKEITFFRKTSTKGHLFASITEKDVIKKLKEEIQLALEPTHIKMKAHLKELGKHKIKIHIGETNTPLMIIIESEE